MDLKLETAIYTVEDPEAGTAVSNYIASWYLKLLL